MKTDLNKIQIKNNTGIRESIKFMDEIGLGILFVIDEKMNILGLVTDGDFRRAILSGIDLNQEIEQIKNTNFKFATLNTNKNEIISIFKNSKIRHLPIIENNKLVDLILKEDILKDDFQFSNFTKNLSIPVIIMAGGKGTRLDPFTRILPKPLIPIGDKPVIEIIMDEYAKFGINDFYISVNHKANMIKAYFEDKQAKYNINYIQEEKPLGTAGALKFIENKINSTFYVSNCDIIIDDDYSQIFEFHKNNNFDLTLVASMQNHTIPYGVCEIESGGVLKKINEKPQFDFLVNTGMYILEPDTLKYIPENEFFHITHLIEKLQQNGKKVGVYPVSEKSWIDVGQWEEYKKAVKLLT